MSEIRLFELLEGYVEATLTEAQRAELEALLASSPEARRVFGEYLSQHALLRKLMVEAGGRRMARPQWRRPVLWIPAAACAAVVLAALIYALWPAPGPASNLAGGPPPRPPAPLAPPPLPAPAVPDPLKPEPLPPRPLPEEKAPAPVAPAPERPVPPPDATIPPKAPDAPPPKPAPKPDLPPPKPEPPRRTVTMVGQLERVAGEAFVATASGRSRAAEKQEVAAGEWLETPGRESLIWLRCADGSRLELGPHSRVRELRDEPGRRIVVERGLVMADVARQPAGAALVIQTPQAEARVAGTRLVVRVTPDSERFEVREGKARLSRRSESASVEVVADSHAVVAKGVPLASRQSRVHDDLVALYRFGDGPVDVIRDLSASGASLDLEINNPKNVAWAPDGLTFKSWTHIGTQHGAKKIAEACRKSREITLEAWVVPAKASQTYEGVLIAMWEHPARNFSLSQGAGNPGAFIASLRTSATDAAPKPLAAPKGTVETKPAHVVYTRAASGAERLFVNGIPRAAAVRGGDFSSWNDSYRLVLGVEWLGEFRLAAVYSRALKDAEVVRNFKLGVD